MNEKILPAWLFPAAFWVTLALLALGLIVPEASAAGVLALLVTPVVAALVVIVTHARRDRRLAVAAALALAGLVVVVILRGLVTNLG